MSSKRISQKIDVLKSILIAKATGREASDDTYKNLREEILTVSQIQNELPEFLFHLENLTEFWNFIQPQSSTYQGRRDYLHDAFEPVLSFLESNLIDSKEKVERPSIFLAHSSQDKFFVRRLAEELRQNGANVWIDEAEIKVGDSLSEIIGKAIKETDYFGVVLSHNSVNSEWVQKELQIAIQKEIREGKVVVLPILMESVEIPPFLIDKLYADFTTPDKFEPSVKKLLNSLGIEVIKVTKKEEKQPNKVWVSEAKDLLMGFDDIRIVGIDENRTYNPDRSKLLYNIYLTLSTEPLSDWVEIFNAERRFPRHTMWRRAWIEGKNIVVHCPLDELEKYHLKDLQQDVETTNKKYRQYLGEMAQRKAKAELEEREERSRIQELRRRLKFE